MPFFDSILCLVYVKRPGGKESEKKGNQIQLAHYQKAALLGDSVKGSEVVLSRREGEELRRCPPSSTPLSPHQNYLLLVKMTHTHTLGSKKPSKCVTEVHPQSQQQFTHNPFKFFSRAHQALCTQREP